MRIVRSNESIALDIFRLTVDGTYTADAGQFYMLRAWGAYPLLSRPVSVHDLNAGSITFLYRVVGAGTELLAKLSPGDELTLDGPFGRGYPPIAPEARLAIVGGGMGIAPLLLTARRNPKAKVFLGYTNLPFAAEQFQAIHSNVTISSGGTIADYVNPLEFDVIFACGPLPLMEVLASKCRGLQVKLYISVEKRMACGVGACCGCTVTVNNGNQKVCVDGPVFEAEGVDYDSLLNL